jgi:hypothetical protein
VIKPNGNEKWKAGSKYEIRWSLGKSNVGGPNHVKINLLKSGKHYLWISKSNAKTPHDGSFIWTIPTSVPTGSNYTIRILKPGWWSNLDTSDKAFTITKTKTNGGGSSLSVITPNGGQKWKTGMSYALKWTHKIAGSKVKIQLLKSGKHYQWVSKSTMNDGKHVWKIPSAVATGSAYKIKITSTSKKTVTDTSNKNFTITKSGGGGGDDDDDDGGDDDDDDDDDDDGGDDGGGDTGRSLPLVN